MKKVNIIIQSSLLIGAKDTAHKGQILRVPENVAASWIKAGYAKKSEDQSEEIATDKTHLFIKKEAQPEQSSAGAGGDTLPDDFPARDKLIAQGIDTIEKVKAVEDLVDLEGIGEATAEKIIEALSV